MLTANQIFRNGILEILQTGDEALEEPRRQWALRKQVFIGMDEIQVENLAELQEIESPAFPDYEAAYIVGSVVFSDLEAAWELVERGYPHQALILLRTVMETGLRLTHAALARKVRDWERAESIEIRDTNGALQKMEKLSYGKLIDALDAAQRERSAELQHNVSGDYTHLHQKAVLEGHRKFLWQFKPDDHVHRLAGPLGIATASTRAHMANFIRDFEGKHSAEFEEVNRAFVREVMGQIGRCADVQWRSRIAESSALMDLETEMSIQSVWDGLNSGELTEDDMPRAVEEFNERLQHSAQRWQGLAERVSRAGRDDGGP